MLRALVALLLLANLLFFLWARGSLAPALPPPHQGEREPERVAAQLNPQSLRLLTPQAVKAAVAAAQVECLEAGPFSAAEAASAASALTDAGVPQTAWSDRTAATPADWVVYMGRYASAAALRAKSAELERLNVAFEPLTEPPELAPGLVLSHHADQAEAEAALAEVVGHGVHTARVVSLPQPPRHWLRAERADQALRARLAALQPGQATLAFAPCAAR